MSIHLVLTDTILESMAKEVEKRMGITTIRVKEFIEKTTPEELIVRGIVASIKNPEKVAGRR